MSRVTTDNLRSQIDQADAGFRDLFEGVTTGEIQKTLELFSGAAEKCPATAVFATISDLGPVAPKMIAAALGRAVAQVLLSRWESEEMEGVDGGDKV